MPFKYKCVLLVGATSGIGLAFAERIVAEGSKVIVVGRRKDRLEAFVAKHGSAKASLIQYDLNDTEGLSAFAKHAIDMNPDLDCVFLNAGVQNAYDFSKPDTVDLTKFHAETSVNFNRFVDVTHAFLPYLIAKTDQRSIIYTNSNLAAVPTSLLPAYCASKAALNVFAMGIREQLQHAGSDLKVIEVWPPVVQSELHDYQGPGGRRMGIPAGQFVDEAWPGLQKGDDLVIVGSIGPRDEFVSLVEKRRKMFDDLVAMMRKR